MDTGPVRRAEALWFGRDMRSGQFLARLGWLWLMEYYFAQREVWFVPSRRLAEQLEKRLG